MALQTIDIKQYWVCSTGEEIDQATPLDDLIAAIALMNEKNTTDEYETWSVVADVNV